MSFLGYLINGISLGSVYAIIALGYTMVYGIAKMLNFAHGDVIMVGAFVIYTAMSSLGLSPILSVILAMVLCTILGMTIEKIAYRPLRNAGSPLAVLITAIGVSYLLQNLGLLIFGADTKAFKSIVNMEALQFAEGQLAVSGEAIVTIITSIVIMLALTSFVKYTKALTLSPDLAEAYFNRGLTFIYTNKNDEGISDLSKAGERGIYSAYNVIKRYSENKK